MSAKNKGAAANGHPHMNKIFQDVVYHQKIDNVKSDPESSCSDTEIIFQQKAKALSDDLRKYQNPCDFTVRIDYLCKKHGVTKQSLLSLRKEVLEELKNAASRNASTLIEDTEPAEEAVDMDKVLDLIYETLKRFIVGDERLLVRATLWIAHTYFADELFISPIALITAPQSNCGKSLLMTVMMQMCNKTFPASASMSESAMFRIIENACPTIGLDEADLNLHNRPEMQGIINAGHMRSTAWVFRVDLNTNEVLKFSTFCPKIITGIRSSQIRETLTNRSIILSMRRKRPSDKIETYQHVKMQSVASRIRRKMKRAAMDAIDSGTFNIEQDFDWPEWLDDGRARDNWTPLFAIAKIASDLWYRRALLASRDEESQTFDQDKQLLIDLIEILNESTSDYISVPEMIKQLLAVNSDWQYVNCGSSINTRWLGLRLASYGLQSVRIRDNGRQIRVYSKQKMLQTFASYVSLCDLPFEMKITAPSDETNNDYDEKLLSDLRDILSHTEKAYISLQELLQQLLATSGEWHIANNGGPVNAFWLSQWLNAYHLKSVRIRDNGRQRRAYPTKELLNAVAQLLNEDVELIADFRSENEENLDQELVSDLIKEVENQPSQIVAAKDCVEGLLRKSERWQTANSNRPINTRWLCAKLAKRDLKQTRFRSDGKQVWAYEKQTLMSALKAWQQDFE